MFDSVNPPAWVSEGSVRKFHRAVKELRINKQEVTEAAVRALYEQYGGLVIDTTKAVEAPAEEAPKKSRKA